MQYTLKNILQILGAVIMLKQDYNKLIERGMRAILLDEFNN